MSSFCGIGCMSGSSLDGMDLCYVEFTVDTQTDKWGYEIIKATTIPYTTEWKNKLRNAPRLSGEQLIKLHIDYGHFIGETINNFIEKENILILNFVASHGHTVFHQPNLGYTFQLGDGETTAVYLKHPFVCNFRNKDVALCGQGAPLVPNGEKFLFSATEICINLGGIANIGVKGFQGYDVCPFNYVSNKLANIYDPTLEFDPEGEIASKGTIIPGILAQLDSLPFYSKLPPRSLGAEWIESEVLPILDSKKHSIPDLLRTYAEHTTDKLLEACKQARDVLHLENASKHKQSLHVLVTGGGAFNTHTFRLLRSKLQVEGFCLEETDNDTIAFKEALIFAFLGLRCLLNQENIMSSVTGSKNNSISGSIHRPAHSNVTASTIVRFPMERNKSRTEPSTSESNIQHIVKMGK